MFISEHHAQNIVNEMKLAIHKDINIMDEEGVIIASTNPVRCGQKHQGAVRIIRESLSSLLIQEDDPASGVQAGINLPIMFHGETVGVIGITGDPAEVSVFGDIIKRMTEIMVESAKQQEQADLIDRAKSLFVENWLFAERLDWAELRLRGRLLGIDISAPYTVALLHLTDAASGTAPEDPDEIRNSRILSTIQSQILDGKKHFCVVIRNQIILLLHRSSKEETHKILTRVSQTINSYYHRQIRGGVSRPSQDAKDIRHCYLEAQMAEAIANRASQNKIIFYDESSFEFIVGSIPQSIRENLQEMVFSACTPEEKRDFIELIRLYFDQNGNINSCAEALYVHRNTIQYRIDQLWKKTGYHLRRAKEATLLYFASYEES